MPDPQRRGSSIAERPPGGVDLEPVRAALAEVGTVSEADVIPLLERLQDLYGYLPTEVLDAVAEETDVPLGRIVGVATFYEEFSLTPRGKHVVRACRGTACHVRGGAHIAEAIRKHLGIRPGETTPDNVFTFQTVACLGLCFLSPAMMVDKACYGRLTPDKVASILDQCRAYSIAETPT